jgi:type VI secretion system protein ImpL
MTGAVLVVYLVLVWFIGTWLQLRGFDLWMLRGALWLIGLVAAGTFLWFHHKRKSAQADSAAAPEGRPESSDIALLVHEASRRLKSSTLGRGATLGKLPLIFLLGESGSTKTTTVLHSDLEAELLAGQVFQDNNVLPTRVANIWYTREALFVDTAGDLVRQRDRWKRLIKLVQPGRMSSVIGNRRQAPRAAIVCFDTANFLQPGASEATLLAARKLASRLHEISQTLSISFPVYVLFTKLDRVSFFTEFVRGFSRDEASEVLGATLPVRSLASGAYSEEETRRLTKTFDELFFSLAGKRTELLGRENEGDKLAGIYEFPRELRKLRSLLVQFLVDLGRPSQLTVNPFLRGFYFSGVRPLLVEDAVQAPKVEAAPEPEFDAGATRIVGGGAAQPQRSPLPARVAGSRKVPQWVFLSRLFNEVIVKDRVALAASGFNSRVSLLRRLALGFVTAIGLVCIVAFVISFVGNRSLENSVQTAVEQLRTAGQPAVNQPPSLSDLQDLERLRQELVVLSTYRRDGVPWHLRWGLYLGDRIYPDARRVYFGRFRQLLLSNTQARLRSSFQSLAVKPGANDQYDETYEGLKAYLITTSHHEKSTQPFLSPVLTSRWAAGKNVDTGYLNLVKSQFDFYSTELVSANPFSSDNDAAAVARARAYLGQFGGVDRYYRPIVDEASRKFPSVGFNDQFTNSGGVFVSDRRVPGAFTRSAFSFVQDAIRNPSRYMSAEDWVLGQATASELDQAAIQQKLTQRYYHDYVNEWRGLLMTSHVVKFGLPEAYDRLDKLTSPISPLLEVLWLVSYNTDVGVPAIANVFAPVAAIEKPVPRDQLIQGFVNSDNTPYVSALAKVGVDVDAYERTPADPNLSTQALHSAGSADLAARAVTSAHIDIANHTEEAVRKLLEEPIVYVEDGLTKTPIDALNAAGQGFCQRFGALRNYYPFNPASSVDLPVEQLNAIFVPGTGALWSFYNDAKLATYLSRDGSRYVLNPSAPTTVKITPEFLGFFNRMVAFSDAFYPQGSTTPQFAYTLKELQSEGLSLKVGAETLSAAGQQKAFKWTGGAEEVQIMTTIGAVLLQTYPGPWSIFKFVVDSHPAAWGPSTDLEWILQVKGKNVIAEGKNKSFNYELQVSGANPFRASELSSLRCVATVAKQGQ